MLPSFSNYGHYRSGNYGAHSLVFDSPMITVWFSYQTPVAFRCAGYQNGALFIRENDWGPTTGKHLNWIDRYAPRITGAEFEKHLKAAISTYART